MNTLKNWLRYQFDSMMSKGTISLIFWLFFATAAMLSAIAILANFTEDGQAIPFLQLIWMGLMRTMDPGTMGGDEGSWQFLLLMLIATVGGIFLVGTLIGILTTGIDQKLIELRKGRSLVIENNHTIILGWSSQIFAVINELAAANENQHRSCIVILSHKDKLEMEDEIKVKVKNPGKTRIVCRTGDPQDLDDLKIVSLNEARSIILLSPDNKYPDVYVIKCLLAIINNPNRSAKPYHIVTAIQEPANLDAARYIGGDEAQIVLTDDLISRITAQTCRQSGLSVVYTELLDFSGDEIYFHLEPSLAGTTFGEALLRYEQSTLIGLFSNNQKVSINPPKDYLLLKDDQLIMISKDDDTIHLEKNDRVNIDHSEIVENLLEVPGIEKTIILGWNHRAPSIIQELDQYVAKGSELVIVANINIGQMESDCTDYQLINHKITYIQGDTTNRRTLDRLNIPAFDHVIILNYSNQLDSQLADAQTLVTLLHLRDIADKNENPFSIVTEMMDIRNRELAEVTKADDFIVSDKLISLMLTQIAENKNLVAVFQDLFDPIGSEIYLNPASHYVKLTKPVNFYTVIESARRKNQVAIGYRIQKLSNNPHEHYGVVINPSKSKNINFTTEDKIIVISDQ